MKAHEWEDDDLAAYALGSLSALESQRLEEHVMQCQTCRKEIVRYQAASDLIALSVPQVPPPPQLKVRVLEAARTPTASKPARPRRALAGWFSFNPWRTGFMAVAGLSLVVSLVSLGWSMSLLRQLHQQQEDTRRLAEAMHVQVAENQRLAERINGQTEILRVLYAPSLAMSLAQATQMAPEAGGRFYVDYTSNKAVLLVYHMPPTPQGQGYQLWLTKGNDRMNGGMLSLTRDGNGWVVVAPADDLRSYDTLGVTMESREGNPAPTGDKYIGAAFP